MATSQSTDIGWLLDRAARDPNTGCWVWQNAPNHNGYGFVVIGPVGAKKYHRVHRLVYESFCAPIPDSMMVCHRCDNRLCINPTHLFLGTAADNNADARAKGRAKCFGGCKPRKYTDADIAEMRRLSATGVSIRQIAAQFGASRPFVYRVVSGERRAV